MFEDIPVDVSPMHEGERIRAAKMFVELAGPKSMGAELIQVADDVEDGVAEVGIPIPGWLKGVLFSILLITVVSMLIYAFLKWKVES